MCSHYEGMKEKKRLERYFGVEYPNDWQPVFEKDDMWTTYQNLFIRRPKEADLDTGDEAVPEREVLLGQWGLLPNFAKDRKFGVKTYNARSEEVAEKPSFRTAWSKARHCIVPAEAIYEPDWRTGTHIPTRFTNADGSPLGIAGLWSWCKLPDGEELYSYTMLTMDAQEHAVFRHYHKGPDKRMVIILNPDSYDAWLSAPVEQSQDFMRHYQAEKLLAEPMEAPPRKLKTAKPPTPMPDGQLF
jgi:putative SOS response-associated peptidase YedK